MIDEITALKMIAQGERLHVEFKENVPSKVRELSEMSEKMSGTQSKERPSGSRIFLDRF